MYRLQYLTGLHYSPAMPGKPSMKTCILCSRTDDPVMECVENFIKENIGNVNLHEIVTQILDVLNEKEPQATHEEVAIHITEHIKHPKVVMQQKLSELVTLSHLAKEASVYECSETGTQQVDSKMLAFFFLFARKVYFGAKSTPRCSGVTRTDRDRHLPSANATTYSDVCVVTQCVCVCARARCMR